MAFGAWPSLGSLAAETLPMNTSAAPDDEAFWAQVRSQFEWEPYSSNFVTAVRDISPKHVSELAVARATEINSLEIAKVFTPNWKQDLRRKVADFIGAPVDNVALLRNTTEDVTTVLSHWQLQQGDEILASSAEHGPFYDTFGAACCTRWRDDPAVPPSRSRRFDALYRRRRRTRDDTTHPPRDDRPYCIVRCDQSRAGHSRCGAC